MTLTLQKFKPMRGKIFVTDLERGMSKTAGGIIMTDDNMKERGIKPRWGKVAMIGDEVEEVSVGEWVLIEHGRWTMGIEYRDEDTDDLVMVWMVEPKAMLVATPNDPRDNRFSF